MKDCVFLIVENVSAILETIHSYVIIYKLLNFIADCKIYTIPDLV